MIDDKTLVDRMLNVFEETPEIAAWFERDGQFRHYEKCEVRDHLLGMWETMQKAAHRIKAQAAEIEQAATEERAKVVAWLQMVKDDYRDPDGELAAKIEAGEHLK
jgi:hypothetical protein